MPMSPYFELQGLLSQNCHLDSKVTCLHFVFSVNISYLEYQIRFLYISVSPVYPWVDKSNLNKNKKTFDVIQVEKKNFHIESYLKMFVDKMCHNKRLLTSVCLLFV